MTTPPQLPFFVQLNATASWLPMLAKIEFS
jgi:hypothetical protein